jgi:hypothetical protein
MTSPPEESGERPRADPSGPDRSRQPELEHRHGRPVQDSSTTRFEPGVRAQVAAIYLIEREAIRLRRLRWQEIKSGAENVAGVAPSGREEFDLAVYARPPPKSSPSEAASGSFRARLKAFFHPRSRGNP